MSRPEWIDDAFQAFAHPLRRELLCGLHESDYTSLDIDQLSRTLAAAFEDATVHEIRMQLRHFHLPRLEQVGFIEFDHQSGDIQYQPNPFVERIIRSQACECSDLEEPQDHSI